MAKKKKPTANPARGFATTSVASKPKIEKTSSTPDPLLSKEETGVTSIAASVIASEEHARESTLLYERETHELSPEELEKRLEEAELQGLVEKYAAKSNKDSSRYVAKLLTDCRVLRGHAQPLQIRGLLTHDMVTKILHLAAEDVRAGRLATSDDKSIGKLELQEEDLTVKLWTLQRALLGLGFLESQVDNALGFVLDSLPVIDNNVAIWGLDEATDWLVLNVTEEELPHFDAQTGKLQTISKRETLAVSISNMIRRYNHAVEWFSNKTIADSSGTQTPNSNVANLESELQIPEFQTSKTVSAIAPEILDSEMASVTDLDSDMEPDELLAVYVSTKLQLNELRPGQGIGNIRASNKSLVASSGVVKSITKQEKKLQANLQKIESDILFDKDEADRQWMLKRNQIVQEAAERRKLQLPTAPQERRQIPTKAPENGGDPIFTGRDSDSSDSDEDTAFRDLFGAVTANALASSNGTTAHHVEPGLNLTIRNFDQIQGLTPWRVLQEACRARDSRSSLKFTLVSLSAFANRHSLEITWSKDQDISFPLQSDIVQCVRSSISSTFTMISIATPDEQQSKAYVSTFALFQIFSTSTKEEKVYLRLSTVWKDLWMEFAEQRKAELVAADRDNLRKLRDLVRQKIESDDGRDDVVLTRNFQKRINDTSGRSSPRISEKEPTFTSSSDGQLLKSIWIAKSSSLAFQRMLPARMNLPMFLFRDAALTAVEQNQVTILCGETGCGKSTQMPSYILERELSLGRPCKIYCTEPRRISAITLAQRVSEELGENKHDVGTSRSLVGYAIRLESHVSSSTRLVYATTGIVLRMLESSDGFQEVSHIIIDEVHERSIETDFLLIILRSLLLKRPELKVVLMSATVDAQRFANYFSGAPILNVPGRTFPVETKFLEDAIEVTGYSPDESANDRNDTEEEDGTDQHQSNSSQATSTTRLQGYSVKTKNTLATFDEYRVEYALIIKLIHMIAFDPEFIKYSQAILVFLPGLAEIRRLNDMLHGTKISQHYLIHSLHSSIASEDQQAAFVLPPRGLGKIVLSTNIAETGVTIPDITCVIDTGKHKEMRFDERRQISRLIESFISRANAKQRRGRAGRVQAGLCFHLFTKSRHDEMMADQQTPEMLRLSLQDLVMRVKICKLGDIQSTLADALDAPSAKNIHRAIDALIDVGALTVSEELTPLGQQLSKLPLDPYLGKLVLLGAVFGCLDVSLTLAATLTSKSPFLTPIGARAQADAARQSFKKGDSDLLTEFNAYTAWRRVCTNFAASNNSVYSEAQFCKKSLLSAQTLSNIEDLKAQFLGSIADVGLVNLSSADRSALNRIQNSSSYRTRRFVIIPPEVNVHASNTELISSVIAWSFYPKLLVRDGKGWRNISTNQTISLHPTSVVRSSPLSNTKYLSFYSILQSSGSKNYNANSLTPANPLSLLILTGDASFHPIAHVVSIDSVRLRFALDGWKISVALKYLRRRMEEVVDRAWKGKLGGTGLAGPGVGKRLEKWMEIWDQLVGEWAAREVVKEP